MDERSIGLFIHIVGGLGWFVALGLEWTGLRQMRSATLPQQVRDWMGIIKSAWRLGFVAMLAIVITGTYPMLTGWRGVAWSNVSLGALALVVLLSQVLSGPRIASIEHALATEKGPVSQSFHDLANQPLLWISLQIRIAIALGIVLLMAAKPDVGGALLILGVAIVLGLTAALPFLRHERAQERPAD
jgi:hypothetical protein